MALAALIGVFFIVGLAIVLFAFPPNKIVEWMSKPADKPGDKKT
jgi:hypothetical protein